MLSLLPNRRRMIGGLYFGPAGWQPIEVKVRIELPGAAPPNQLRVMWRREAGCVLTVAVAGRA